MNIKPNIAKKIRLGSGSLFAVALIVLAGLHPITTQNLLAESDSAVMTTDITLQAESLSAAFRAVAKQAETSAVRVIGYNTMGYVTGSGFVIRSDGYLLTNNHVAAPSANMYVEFFDGSSYPAEVVGTDPLTDLAVLHIDKTDLPVMKMMTEDNLQVGDWVIAVGCPMGLEQTVTTGIVSAINRKLGIIGDAGRAGYEDFIQTDAAINQGNSGGPLVNLKGEIVGVNSAIVTRTGGSDGLGFAIPASLASYISTELINEGCVSRGYLGVGIQDIDSVLAQSYGLQEDQRGALILTVDPDYPAAKAGLKVEDLIIDIDGHPIGNTSELRNLVATMKPGTEVHLTIIRDAKKRNYNITLGAMEESADQNVVRVNNSKRDRIGIQLADTRPSSYVLVRNIIPGGIAYLAGIRSNDIITEVNGKEVVEQANKQRMSPAKWVDTLIVDSQPGTILRFKISRPTGRRSFETVILAIEIP